MLPVIVNFDYALRTLKNLNNVMQKAIAIVIM